MNIYEVLRKPVISEKALDLRDNHGKYVFLVHLKANKYDIKNAIEKTFDVSVEKVTTNITRGKYKRKGARIFLEPSKKKAIVTLGSGQKLPLFEEQ
jgi:large subunit ribosomal protein L23